MAFLFYKSGRIAFTFLPGLQAVVDFSVVLGLYCRCNSCGRNHDELDEGSPE